LWCWASVYVRLDIGGLVYITIWLGIVSLVRIPEFAVGERVVVLYDHVLLRVKRVIAVGYIITLIGIKCRIITYYIEGIVSR